MSHSIRKVLYATVRSAALGAAAATIAGLLGRMGSDHLPLLFRFSIDRLQVDVGIDP
jgi:hypothetical protein